MPIEEYKWFYPTNSENMKSFPSDTIATSLRHHKNLTDEELYELPESLERVYIACSSNISHLRGLHHLKNLKFLDIDVCCSITKEALDEIKIALPNCNVNTWGCWQLSDSCPEVQQQSDELFINYLGGRTPRLCSNV